MVEGNIENLWQANSVIIDELAQRRFSEGRPKPIGLGDTFEINDHEARIVGICKVERSFFGYPFIFTTFDRAISMAPKRRKDLSFILVQPQEGITPETLARHIESKTELKAYTSDEFSVSTVRWLFKNTGIPVSFGTTIILGFIVGIAVSGQTFYAFILENLPHFRGFKSYGRIQQTPL